MGKGMIHRGFSKCAQKELEGSGMLPTPDTLNTKILKNVSQIDVFFIPDGGTCIYFLSPKLLERFD